MAIRITGLNSGLDTESIVSALVSAYSYKTQKYEKAQTKLSWKQDAWKSLNTKIYSLYSSISSLRYSSAYNLKSSSMSDTTKATVTATSSAVNGSYSLQVTSLAKAGYLTGGQLASGTTSSTTVSSLTGYSGEGTISLSTGGTATDISITSSTTISEVLNQLKDAGVNASYDETNRRIYVSAKSTGEDNDFSLTGSDENGSAALAALGLSTESVTNSAEYEELVSTYVDSDGNLMDASDIQAIVDAKVAAEEENEELTAKNAKYQYAVDYANAYISVQSYRGASGMSNSDYDLMDTLASKASKFGDSVYTDADGNLFTYNSGMNMYVDEDGNNVDVLDSSVQDLTLASDKLNELAISAGMSTTDDDGNTVVDSTALTAYEANITTLNSIETTAESDSDVASMIADIKNAYASGSDTTASVAAVTSLITDTYQSEITANEATIAENEATISDYSYITSDMTSDEISSLVSRINYAQSVVDGTTTIHYSSGATRVNGSNAEIYVNGAQYTGESNTFSINGLTISATAVTGTTYDETESSATNITVSTDTQGLYDQIKDFLTQYNSLINEMTSLYNADSASAYEPLTDDEKSAMTDSQIEKWEAKIQDAILRRDSTLDSVMSTMITSMSQSYTIDGKSYSLSSFGIQTLGLLSAGDNEQNAYHIYGDSDDSAVSGNTDKLMAALSNDPDTVIEYMKQLTSGLYTAIDNKMKSTTLSSAYTIYNDKEMASEYSDYTTTIKKWQDKTTDLEDYYYSKFTAMETALATLNSQSSSLSSLLG